MSKLTELDMLLTEVNKILEEFDDKRVVPNSNKDEKQDKVVIIKRNIAILITDIDTLLDERDRIPLDAVGADVLQKKYKNQNATEEKLNHLKSELDNFNQEIKSLMKNKSKNKSNYNIQLLEEQYKNYGEQYEDLRARLNGIPVARKARPNSFNNIENLDKLLEDRKNQGPEREMYQEERDKIDQWKNDIKDQDKQLEDVALDVKKMKLNVKDIERGIDKVGKNIDKTSKMADKTHTVLERSNKKLKEILEKVGGPANFCVDVVLICVCLGLIAVLYNIIKSQTGKSSSTGAAATTLRILGEFE